MELKLLSPHNFGTSSSSLSALVLAAALVEGALAFVVRHALKQSLGLFGSTDFAKDPKSWRIDDLVASAARGGDSAVLDTLSRTRWTASFERGNASTPSGCFQNIQLVLCRTFGRKKPAKRASPSRWCAPCCTG
jgi:hypothetical protein